MKILNHHHDVFVPDLQLLDKSNQWWKVRDSRGVEGYVPNNVLKPNDEEPVLVRDEPIRTSNLSCTCSDV